MDAVRTPSTWAAARVMKAPEASPQPAPREDEEPTPPKTLPAGSFRVLARNESSSISGSGHLSSKLTRSKSGLEYSSEYVFLAVAFDPTGFRVAWIVMFLLRLWCILFLAWSARLYWFVAHPYMAYYAGLLGPTAVDNFKPMGVCFGLLAALHGYQLAKMLYASFIYGTLAMGTPPRSLGPDGGVKCFRGWLRSPRHFLKAIRRDFARLFFDRHGPFGVENRYYFLRMLVSEVVEIASQTTQVRKASVLVSKVWMNNLYVIMTVFNAWSTPLLRFIFRRTHTKIISASTAAVERLACLATDFVLDAATGMVIPMLIFVPYYQKFNFEDFNFETAFLYDDIWFANMVMENQQIFALTQWDFVFKMIPHISIYSSLNSIRALIRHPEPPLSARVYAAAAAPPAASNESEDDTATKPGGSASDKRFHRAQSVAAIPEGEQAELPFPTESEGFVNALKIETFVRPDSKTHRLVQRVLSIILFLIGLAVLVFHLLAYKTAHTKVLSCATMSRPWFATKLSCSVVRFNCHMNNVTTITDDDLALINPSSVSAIVISHCPELRVPHSIRDFHNLLGIDVYNCTLVEWSAAAAVTPDAHPRITYLIFVRTNMTRLPDGILQPLPDTLGDFEIVVSNLTELPDDLHERWSTMPLIYIEHAQLTEFPPSLLYLGVSEVSLLGNKITTLPEFDPELIAFYSLTLAHNPIERLPESIGDTSDLGFLSLSNTQLTEFPAWMDEVALTASRIFIHNTPFCNSRSDAELRDRYGSEAVLTCDILSDEHHDGLYPLVIMAQRRLYDDSAAIASVTFTSADVGD